MKGADFECCRKYAVCEHTRPSPPAEPKCEYFKCNQCSEVFTPSTEKFAFSEKAFCKHICKEEYLWNQRMREDSTSKPYPSPIPADRPPTTEPAESEGKTAALDSKCECLYWARTREMMMFAHHPRCPADAGSPAPICTAPPAEREDARAWMAKEYDIPLKNVPDDGRLEVMAQFAIEYAAKQIERYRIALADAIRRPMGVVPDSAQGLVSQEDVDAAEARRPGSTKE